MKKVPDMISTKDLAYISDMFNWNITAYQKVNYYMKTCKDKDICDEFKKVSNMHLDNCNKLLDILKEAK